MASPPASSPTGLGLSRRAFLAGAGAVGGLAMARGLGVGRPTSVSRASDEILREFASTLTDHQRSLIVLPADHPSRQIINTVSVLDRPHLGTLLSPRQLGLVDELAGSMLSPRGRADFAGTFAVEGRFEGCVLAVYGEPSQPGALAVLQGGHVMLRGGGATADLGGGLAYGHQIGNQAWRVPGNSFAWHGDRANALMERLTATERTRAIQTQRPHELVLQPRGSAEGIPGVAFADLAPRPRRAAEALVDAVLGSFPESDRSAARSALDAHGGLDALHFATFADKGFYADMAAWGSLTQEERVTRGDPYWQVWRIEGPGAVVHFQGHPHVHAYVNIVGDPGAANVGESIAETTGVIEGAPMGRLLDAALQRATGEPLAWHGVEVPGRFCPGAITTGLAYALDPYANEIVVATIPEPGMGPSLREWLTGAGVSIGPGESVRLATIGYMARESGLLGDVADVESTGMLMRDALIAHLRAGGLDDRA